MISISQTTLSSTLSAVTRASQRSSLPAFSIVRLDAKPEGELHLSCFNGETAARAVVHLPCQDEFSVSVDAQTFKAIVDTLEGEVHISISDNALLLENGANRTTLRLVEESIPLIDDVGIPLLTALPGHALRSLLRVLPFASTDDARPSLSVLHLTIGTTSLIAQAADGYTAARVEDTISGPREEKSLSLPAGFARLLSSLVEDADLVKIRSSGEHHCIIELSNSDCGKDLTLATVLGDANFPGEQVGQLMAAARKDATSHLSLQRAGLLQTLRMVNAMGTQNTFLKATNGSVKMASEETTTGRARNVLDGDASGQDAHVWLSAAFLKRAVEESKGTLSIQIAGDKKPVLLEKGSFTALIMPLLMEEQPDPFPDDEPIALGPPAMAEA